MDAEVRIGDASPRGRDGVRFCDARVQERRFQRVVAGRPGGFAPEWAWSYEGGLKTVLGGGRARLNVAAFYTDYTDLQVKTAIRPGVLDISNAAAATIRGMSWKPRHL